MWKLVDKISGMKFESKLRYQILEIGQDLIDDYKQQNMETYITYQGDETYFLDEYPIK
jgi:hypothetical protein